MTPFDVKTPPRAQTCQSVPCSQRARMLQKCLWGWGLLAGATAACKLNLKACIPRPLSKGYSRSVQGSGIKKASLFGKEMPCEKALG